MAAQFIANAYKTLYRDLVDKIRALQTARLTEMTNEPNKYVRHFINPNILGLGTTEEKHPSTPQDKSHFIYDNNISGGMKHPDNIIFCNEQEHFELHYLLHQYYNECIPNNPINPNYAEKVLKNILNANLCEAM
jgi:hypothetical protein